MDLQSDQKYYTRLQEEISKVFESDDKLLMVASVAEAADKLAVVLKQKALIQYDIVTGMFRVGMDNKLDFMWYTELDAKNFFMIVIAPLVRMITGQSPGGVRSRGLNKNEQEQLWCAVKQSNKINSRLEAYEKIEQWDGKSRIATFMKEYFECDCMSNQFLLFMTSVLAKWKNPMARVEYFFDFIGEGKGTGKTSLFVHLFGTKAMILGVPSRKEDLFVSAYTNGALIVCDDECTWIGKGPGKMSYDEFKTLVTLQIDTFSRKHAQPESHYRPFVIVRTSNDPRTVFSANERRQIIFNVGLGERECRHWNMSDYDRDQLIAEAKDYVEKHNGEPYRLTKEEERLIEEANLENFDTETVEYDSLIEFFNDLRDNPQDNREFILEPSDAKAYTTCNQYHRWCKKEFYKPLEPRIFWRQVGAIQRKCPGLISFDKAKKKNVMGVPTRVIELLPKKNQEVNYDEIPE